MRNKTSIKLIGYRPEKKKKNRGALSVIGETFFEMPEKNFPMVGCAYLSFFFFFMNYGIGFSLSCFLLIESMVYKVYDRLDCFCYYFFLKKV